MPLFEFHCPECKETFEELLRNVEQSDEVECPTCGNAKVERLQSGFCTVSGSGGSTGSSGSGCSSHGGFS
jgi:putative FmdB family regulatory protein